VIAFGAGFEALFRNRRNQQMAKKRLKPKQRRGPQKKFEYIVGRILVSALQYCPLSINYRIGRLLGFLAWGLLAGRRRIVRKNLRIVNAWMMEQRTPLTDSLNSQVREVFMRAGANVFSGFSFTRMPPDQAEKRMEIVGLDLVIEALARGKGAIVLLGHMGPWEMLPFISSRLAVRGVEAPLAAIYRPFDNLYFDEWYRSFREQYGTALFSRLDGFHKPVDFIRSGGMIGVLADQKMRQGVASEYFGEKCRTNPLPGLFQRRTGAPVISVSISTVEPLRWQIVASIVDFPSEESERSRDLDVAICNRALEVGLSRSPLDVFWFHDRF
jgi:Kdo2-lipid IVA lauroyltransferase/acyltransferase